MPFMHDDVIQQGATSILHVHSLAQLAIRTLQGRISSRNAYPMQPCSCVPELPDKYERYGDSEHWCHNNTTCEPCSEEL